MAAPSGHLRTTDARRGARSLTLAGLVIALFLIFTWPAMVRATTLERLSVEQMAQRATLVVQGDVLSTAVEQTPAGVRTAVRVRVQEPLEGRALRLHDVLRAGRRASGRHAGDRRRHAVLHAGRVVLRVRRCARLGDRWLPGQAGRGRTVASRTSARPPRNSVRRVRAALGRASARELPAPQPLRATGITNPDTENGIEGTVRDYKTNLPIAGATVHVSSKGVDYGTATTDGNGYYLKVPLPAHTNGLTFYDVSVSCPGYLSDGPRNAGGLSYSAEGGYWRRDFVLPPTTPPKTPTITSITPGEASAGTNTKVLISGTNFGDTKGKVEFSYGRKGVMRIAASDISTWQDNRIICVVPTGTIDNYSASAGTGPVVVTDANAVESNAYAFTVTFGYGGAKWANPRVTYYVNPSGIDDALRESLIDAGTSVWNAANSGFQFIDGGTTAVGSADDGMNVISWANGMPDGVLASSRSYVSGGVISQCDIQFSNAYVWGAGEAGSRDIQSTGMHEVGHWLKLLDQYMDGDSTKVMYGYGSAGVQKRALTAADIAGDHLGLPPQAQRHRRPRLLREERDREARQLRAALSEGARRPERQGDDEARHHHAVRLGQEDLDAGLRRELLRMVVRELQVHAQQGYLPPRRHRQGPGRQQRQQGGQGHADGEVVARAGATPSTPKLQHEEVEARPAVAAAGEVVVDRAGAGDVDRAGDESDRGGVVVAPVRLGQVRA